MFSNKKIEGSTKFLMIGTAIAVELLAWILLFIPFVGETANEYIAVFGNLVFLIWFWSNGVSLLKKDKLFNFFGNFLGEAVTFGAWPGFIVMVTRTISKHNKEMSVKEDGNKNDAQGNTEDRKAA